MEIWNLVKSPGKPETIKRRKPFKMVHGLPFTMCQSLITGASGRPFFLKSFKIKAWGRIGGGGQG